MWEEGLLYVHIHSGSERQTEEYVAQCPVEQGM